MGNKIYYFKSLDVVGPISPYLADLKCVLVFLAESIQDPSVKPGPPMDMQQELYR
jgi:hypothetical protein